MSFSKFKWIVWLWLFSLLTASAGVSVQQIYCLCAGKTTYAIFETPLECAVEKAVHPDACCTPQSRVSEKSCCQKSANQQNTRGCTKKSSRYFQLKTECTLATKALESVKVFLLLPGILEPVAPELVFITDTPGIGFTSFAQPPPPLPGRVICLRNGVFRC